MIKLCTFVLFVVFGVVVIGEGGRVVDTYDPETYKSDREEPKDVKTKPDYPGEGAWATPKPNSGIDLGFVPIRTYAQVRHTHTVKQLPRDAALAEAKTYEDIINAPRLREVVSTKKISEVYSEEGYEDSGYDHGGFGRKGESKEGYQKKLAEDDSEVGESEIHSTKHPEDLKRKVNRHRESSQEEKMVYLESSDGVTLKPIDIEYSHTIENPENKKNKKDNREIPRVPKREKKVNDKKPVTYKQSGTFRNPLPPMFSDINIQSNPAVLKSLTNQNSGAFQRVQYPLESSLSYLVQNPLITPTSQIQNSPGNQSPFYQQQSLQSSPTYQNIPQKVIIPRYEPHIRPTFQPSLIELPKYKVSQENNSYYGTVNLEHLHPVSFPRPLTNLQITSPQRQSSEIQKEIIPNINPNYEPIYIRRIIPNHKTLLNINALADLTSSSNRKNKYNRILGTQNTKPLANEKAMYVHLLTSTHLANLQNHTDQIADKTNLGNNNRIRYVTSAHFRNPNLKPLFLNDQENSQNRRSDKIIKQARYLNAEEEERKLEKEEEKIEKDKDEALWREVKTWNNALKAADFKKEPEGVNTNKFPFYYKNSETLSLDSPLRYATNPSSIPIKTEGGMEFYESRDQEYHCPEVKGPGKVTPERGADGEWNKNPRPKLPRLQPLGDKIDCFKEKYFGAEPLDNPFFKEENVESKDNFFQNFIQSINNAQDNIGAYSTPFITTSAKERQAPVREEIDDIPLKTPKYNDKTIFSPLFDRHSNVDSETGKPIDEITFTTSRPNIESESYLNPPPITKTVPESSTRPNNLVKITKLFLIVPKKADVIYITPKPRYALNSAPLPDIIYGKPNIPENQPIQKKSPDSIYAILNNISPRYPRFINTNEMLPSESRRTETKYEEKKNDTKTDINRLRRFGRHRNIVKDDQSKNSTNQEKNTLKRNNRYELMRNRSKIKEDKKDIKEEENNNDKTTKSESNIRKNKEERHTRRGEPKYTDEEGTLQEWQESKKGEIIDNSTEAIKSDEKIFEKKNDIEELIKRNKPKYSSRFRIENLSKYETTTQTLKAPSTQKEETTTDTTTTSTTKNPRGQILKRNQNDSNRGRIYERGRGRFTNSEPSTTTTSTESIRVRPVDRRMNKRREDDTTMSTTTTISSSGEKEDSVSTEKSGEFSDNYDEGSSELESVYGNEKELTIKDEDGDESFKIKELSERVPSEEESKSEQSLEELPRRLKSFERRKVVKEEIITRTFVPDKEESLEEAMKDEDARPGRLNDKAFSSSLEDSYEQLDKAESTKKTRETLKDGSKGFLLLNSKEDPQKYRGRSMTYAVNPRTGTGKWIEQIYEDRWNSDEEPSRESSEEVFDRTPSRRGQANSRGSQYSRRQLEGRRQRIPRQNSHKEFDDESEKDESRRFNSKIIKDPGSRLYYFAE